MRTAMIVAGVLGLIALGAFFAFKTDGPLSPTYSVEVTDYNNPPKRADEIVDDVLDEKRVPAFNPQLVHSEPVEGWEVNLSSAVMHLDTPKLLPDSSADTELLKLHPSYKAALDAVRGHLTPSTRVLPSVNMLDGKAKQFDDGLYAALDLAYYSGLDGALQSHVEFFRKLATELGPDSPASPFVAAGLELAGVSVDVKDAGKKQKCLADFKGRKHLSKPIGFYNWRPELQRCFEFLRFFQQEFDPRDAAANPGGFSVEVLQVMADVLSRNADLRSDYTRMLEFYGKLTNPAHVRSLLDLIEENPPTSARRSRDEIAVLPSSTSREVVLFERMFPNGLPPNADLMRVLIEAIRAGKVDLKPDPQSGWYEYQAYALETLVLPERSEESVKLLLTANYKRRMLEAFQALITRRRETHVRQLGEMKSAAAAPMPLHDLSPRLRVEPLVTYYLRTARAYGFLQQFLDSTMGRERLATLHRLREKDEVSIDLATELESQRLLFYGFYLLGAEDIGLETHLSEQELGDPQRAREQALAWLANYEQDPDLAVDTRVIIPIGYNEGARTMNLWMTVGVRFARVTAEFDLEHRPSTRPVGGEEWTPAESDILSESRFVIPVDEFATFTIQYLDPPTRKEFQSICDEERTKEGIQKRLKALENF